MVLYSVKPHLEQNKKEIAEIEVTGRDFVADFGHPVYVSVVSC